MGITAFLLCMGYFSAVEWYICCHNATTFQVQTAIIGHTSSFKQNYYFVSKECKFSQSSLTFPKTFRGVQHHSYAIEDIGAIYGFYVFNTRTPLDFASQLIRNFENWENYADIKISFGSGWGCFPRTKIEHQIINMRLEIPSTQYDVKVNNMYLSLTKINGKWKMKEFRRLDK